MCNLKLYIYVPIAVGNITVETIKIEVKMQLHHISLILYLLFLYYVIFLLHTY